MEKRALVTLVNSPWLQSVANLTKTNQLQYAKRIGADHVVISANVFAHPSYDKWQLYDLLDHFDRVIYIDADVIIRPDCPSLFEIVPPEMFGGSNELQTFSGKEALLEKFCNQIGMQTPPCRFYVNDSVFVASTCHRPLFRPPAYMPFNLPCPAQDHLNARLLGEYVPVYFLSSNFHDHCRRGNYLQDSYVVKYANLSQDELVRTISRDLAHWASAFGEKSVSCSPVAKPDPSENADWDYVSPEMQRVALDDCFPNLDLGDKQHFPWPHLRRWVPHRWYVDRRMPTVGFVCRDEAHLLYNSALRFRGRRALEIGCWLGWSACHIARAGLYLDIVDPILRRPEVRGSVVNSLLAAGLTSRIILNDNGSPEGVHELAKLGDGRWPFFFVDGNHDAPYPQQDAMTCAGYATEDAMILFHDLASPDVAQGLDYLRDQGWKTMVYQTMQIMGVAWRGKVEPVLHTPDPLVDWTVPDHLQQYDICNGVN